MIVSTATKALRSMAAVVDDEDKAVAAVIAWWIIGASFLAVWIAFIVGIAFRVYGIANG